MKRLVEHERCNEYGSCWIEEYDEIDVETLDELVTFLREVEKNVDREIREHIERIKQILGS